MTSLTAPLGAKKGSFYGEKVQEGYGSIKATMWLTVQITKLAIKLHPHSHVVSSLHNRHLGSNQTFYSLS